MLALGFLDAGSIFSLDSTVTITGASYDASVDEANTLRRAIGRKLVFETGIWKDNVMQTVEAEVLGVEPELYRMPDGTLSFQRPGRPRYPCRPRADRAHAQPQRPQHRGSRITPAGVVQRWRGVGRELRGRSWPRVGPGRGAGRDPARGA